MAAIVNNALTQQVPRDPKNPDGSPGSSTTDVPTPDATGSTPDVTGSPAPTQSTVAPIATGGADPKPGAATPTTDGSTTPPAVTPPAATAAAPPAAPPAAPAAGTGAVAAAMNPDGTPATPTTGPVTRQINQPTDTVAGQLSTLMQSDNPIIAQARANATKLANDRGLANSSMAAQSGEEAAVGSMMPVAQADAAAYQKQAMANQDVQNQFSSMHEQFTQQKEVQAADLATQRSIADKSLQANLADAAARISLGDAQIAASKEMANAQIEASTRIATLDANTRLDLESRQIAANAGLFDAQATLQRSLNMQNLQQNTQNNLTAQVASILSNPNMDEAAKTNAINSLNAVYAGSPFLPPGIHITVNPPAPTNTGNNNDNTHTPDPGGG